MDRDPDAPEGWSIVDGALRRRFRFAGFPDALAFMVAAGCRCEAANHHPDWSNSYDRVDVALTTHSAGRVTDADVALAREMSVIAARFRDRGAH